MRSFLPMGWEGRLAPASGMARRAGCASAEERKIRMTNRRRTAIPLFLLLESVDFEAGQSQRIEESRQGDFEVGKTALQEGKVATKIVATAVRSAQHDLAGEGGQAARTLAIASRFELLEFIICHTKVYKTTSHFLHAGFPF